MARKKTKSKTKNKLESLAVTDGQEQDVQRIKELESLMGLGHTNPFGVSTAAELEQKMDQMNMSDLQALAVRAGLFPSGSRLTLKNKILKQFHSTPGAGAGVDVGYTKPIADPDTPGGKNLIKLMNEGL